MGVKSASSDLLPSGLELGRGEAESITLAQEFPDALLLMDEYQGRAIARALGLRLSGTPGVLRDAHNQGWINGVDSMRALLSTNFRCSKSMRADYFSSLRR